MASQKVKPTEDFDEFNIGERKNPATTTNCHLFFWYIRFLRNEHVNMLY